MAARIWEHELRYTLETSGRELGTLTFRRPTGKDMAWLNDQSKKKNRNDVEMMFELMARLCEDQVSPDEFNAVDSEDITEINEVIGSFLGVKKEEG